MAGRSKRPRELHGIGWFLCAFVGLALGVALFTPWRNIWTRALVSVDEQAPRLRMSWESIDRAGPSGFRVRHMQFGFKGSPGVFRFDHADIRVGLNQWHVRLDTGGPECFLTLDNNGGVAFEGDLNLTYLLASDLRGIVRVSGKLRRTGKDGVPTGWLDLRTQSLILGNRQYEDLAFMGEFQGENVTIRDFSLGAPIHVKAKGTAQLNPDDLMQSLFNVRGEQTVPGGGSMQFERDSSLRTLFSAD